MDEQEFDRLLSKYADVVVQVGLNLQKEQILSIGGILEDAPFIRKVTQSAYKAGAKYVDVLWNDEGSARTRFEYGSPEYVDYVPDWLVNRLDEFMREGNPRLGIISTDPDLFDGIDSGLLAKSRKARMQKFDVLRKYDDLASWCVVATAAPSWAKKVFPEIPVEEAQARLWDAIFKVCRIDTPDPVAQTLQSF